MRMLDRSSGMASAVTLRSQIARSTGGEQGCAHIIAQQPAREFWCVLSVT